MSDLPVPPLARRSMTSADIPAVLAIELRAYGHPWSGGNFADSLAAGHLAEVLVAGAEPVGYFVAQIGADELHLLNMTVAPEHQRRGHARTLLDALGAHARALGLSAIWLEVRASNQRAQQVYRSYGFAHAGVRRGYYPAAGPRREDAVLMTLPLGPEGTVHGAG
jgi:ribosomal-protein-alanine N-acetyltransferase